MLLTCSLPLYLLSCDSWWFSSTFDAFYVVRFDFHPRCILWVARQSQEFLVFAAIIFITRYHQCVLEFISIDRDRSRVFIYVIYYSWPLIIRRKAYFIHSYFIFIWSEKMNHFKWNSVFARSHSQLIYAFECHWLCKASISQMKSERKCCSAIAVTVFSMRERAHWSRRRFTFTFVNHFSLPLKYHQSLATTVTTSSSIVASISLSYERNYI